MCVRAESAACSSKTPITLERRLVIVGNLTEISRASNGTRHQSQKGGSGVNA